MAHLISNCGHDEYGSYTGGKAGDQTGGEWELRSWYNRPWDVVLRHPNEKVQALTAKMAEAAAKNDHIGYDQGQRYTFWEELKKSGYDPAKISAACEADCSSGVAAIVKAVGYRLDIQALKNVSIYLYTGNMRAGLLAAGFKALTGYRYRTSYEYLMPGDILLNEAHHVAVNITRGRKADEGGGDRVGICTIELGTFLVGACDPQVKTVQVLLNSKGYTDQDGNVLAVDGELGERTAYAISCFQKDKGMQNINFGTVGGGTWRYLLG